ncbi:MAG: OmpA family protein [Bacteroidota bacterium]|jgi:outer membrane protein OmpA-like peptidoglycan-associated protein
MKYSLNVCIKKKNTFFKFLLFTSLIGFSQKSEKLRVGERIPFSKLEVLNQEQKLVNIDLPDGKNITDRFVLVYFYSSDSPTKNLISFNNDVERVLNKFQNNNCKGASSIEYVTICIEKDFSKWQKELEETNYNKQKFTGKKTNYLAKDGIKDKAVSVFKLTTTPALYLVNPKGRLYLETDSVLVLDRTFQNICKANASYATADVSGKILFGEKSKTPLIQHQVYLVKENLDTVKKTVTDNFGDFVFTQIDTTASLSIKIQQTNKSNDTKFFLAKQTGEVISEFKKNAVGDFEYRLLNLDVFRLTLIEEEDDIIMKYKKFDVTSKKDLIVNENIYYEVGKYTLVTESEIIFDKIISILMAYPEVKLDVISHTDARGDDNSNLKLSENRSNSVVKYLIEKGIDSSRLRAIGKGETEISNRCANNVNCSDKEQEFNRRTEFKFVKN